MNLWVCVCVFWTMEMENYVNNVENFHGYGWFLFHIFFNMEFHSVGRVFRNKCTHTHMACTKEIIFRVCICRCVCVRVCRQMSIVTCDCSNCILHVFTSNHLIPFLFSLLIQFLFRLLLKFFVSLLSHIQRHAHTLSHNRTNTHENRL